MFYGGVNVTFSNSATAQDLAYLMMTTLGFSDVAIDKSYSVNASVDQFDWLVVFRGDGDVTLLTAFALGGGSCQVSVVEFVKGNANQFSIEPKRLNGDVLKETVTAAGFAGRDVFFTESFLAGAWYRDQGVAVYNPVVYDIQSVFVPQ
jgi:hypothetical protein